MPNCRECGHSYGSSSGRGLCRVCWNNITIRQKHSRIADFSGSKAALLGREQAAIAKQTIGAKVALRKMKQELKQELPNQDEEWIDRLINSKAGLKLRETLGKNSLRVEDAFEFLQSRNYQEAIKETWQQLRRLEMDGRVPQAKINYCRNVLDILCEYLSNKHSHF